MLFHLCPRKHWEKEKERFMSLNNCFTSSSAYIQKASFFFLLRIYFILAENLHHMPGCTILSQPCKIFPLLNVIFHSKTCVYTVESSLFGSKEGKGTGYKMEGDRGLSIVWCILEMENIRLQSKSYALPLQQTHLKRWISLISGSCYSSHIFTTTN